MNLDPYLKSAVYAADLSTDSNRRAACALAIILIERIACAVEDDLDWLDVYLHGYDEDYLALVFAPYEETIHALREARKILHTTYGLNRLQRLGIRNYLLKIDAANKTV